MASLLTLKPVSNNGHVEVWDKTPKPPVLRTMGKARPSNTHPGYVTILFEDTMDCIGVRVPADWIATLQGIELLES